MSDALQIALLMLGTAVVVLLAVLAGALLVTLLEVRKTARQIGETIERIEPPAHETLENLRRASSSASEALGSVQQLSRAIEPVRETALKLGPYLPLLGGLAGLIATLKAIGNLRGGRRGSRG